MRGGPKHKVSEVQQNKTIGQVGEQLTPSPVVDCEKPTSTNVASDSEEETAPIKRLQTKKHPSKNYSKVDLYDKWVHARNQATDRRKEVENLQKELKEEIKSQTGLRKEVEQKENFKLQVYELQEQVKEAEAKF